MKKIIIFLIFLVVACSKDDPISQYSLTVQITPLEGGTVSPESGKFEEGESVSVLATASDQYVFKNWSGDASGTSNPTTVVMKSNKSITAVFEKKDTDGDGIADDVDMCPHTPAGETVDSNGCSESQTTNVPDDNFETYLETHDANGDVVTLGDPTSLGDGTADNNLVLTSRIANVTTLDISHKSISDITGIQDFISLTTLDCSDNNLQSLNFENNTALTTLYCSNDLFGGLNLENNTALTYLDCHGSTLFNLNLETNTLLEYLDCSGMDLSSLNVDNNTALTHLDCTNNENISSLNLENNTALTYLACGDNSLSSLNLETNTALTYLYCSFNNLNSLNVKNGNNTNFTEFDARFNSNLICIQVDDATYSIANWTNIDDQTTFSEDCSAPITYMPDDNFEQALIDLGHDDVMDDYVLTSNIEDITSINLDEKEISDLTGIEDFTALTTLHCSGNPLTSIDVTQNINLQRLYCENNELTSLDVSQNTGLKYLWCSDNLLTNLNLIQNTDLLQLVGQNNQLTSLDVSENTGLKWLYCSDNLLTNLNLIQNTALTSLDCSNNQISNLNISHIIDLEGLNCANNQLSNLDVSQNIDLKYLRCSWNGLASLDVSQNTALIELYCGSNELTSLDISQNIALTILLCGSCQLNNLDVSQNTNLYYLGCGRNDITSLDVSQNIDLTHLDCRYSNNLYCIQVNTTQLNSVPANWYKDDQANYALTCN